MRNRHDLVGLCIRSKLTPVLCEDHAIGVRSRAHHVDKLSPLTFIPSPTKGVSIDGHHRVRPTNHGTQTKHQDASTLIEKE